MRVLVVEDQAKLATTVATVLRNEGVHYGEYISQISFLLFLKMDDEAASQLGEPSGLPADCRWGAIKDLQGEALATRYSKILEKLSRHEGLIGALFLKAQNEIQDPSKLRRLVTRKSATVARSCGRATIFPASISCPRWCGSAP